MNRSLLAAMLSQEAGEHVASGCTYRAPAEISKAVELCQGNEKWLGISHLTRHKLMLQYNNNWGVCFF